MAEKGEGKVLRMPTAWKIQAMYDRALERGEEVDPLDIIKEFENTPIIMKLNGVLTVACSDGSSIQFRGDHMTTVER